MGFLLWLLVAGFGGLYASEEARMSFNIPEGKAIETLRTAALQGEIQILFSDTVVDGVVTNAIRGNYTPRVALALMLKGTGLGIAQANTNGAYAITFAEPEIVALGSTEKSSDPNLETPTIMNLRKQTTNSKNILKGLLSLLVVSSGLSGQEAQEAEEVY